MLELFAGIGGAVVVIGGIAFLCFVVGILPDRIDRLEWRIEKIEKRKRGK